MDVVVESCLLFLNEEMKNKARKEIGWRFLRTADKRYSDLAGDILDRGVYSRNDIRVLREQKTHIRRALLAVIDMIPQIAETQDDVRGHEQTAKRAMEKITKQEFFSDLDDPVKLEVEKVVDTRLVKYFKARKAVAVTVNQLKRSSKLVELVLASDFGCSWPVERFKDNYIFTNEYGNSATIYTDASINSGKCAGMANMNSKLSVVTTHGLSFEQMVNVDSHENRHQFDYYFRDFEYWREDEKLWRAKDEIVAYLSQNIPRGQVDLIETLVNFDGLYSYYRRDFDEEQRLSAKRKIYRKWLVHCRRVVKAINVYFIAKSGGVKLNFNEMMMVPMNEWISLVPAEERRNMRLNSDYCVNLDLYIDDAKSLNDDVIFICNYLEEIKNGGYGKWKAGIIDMAGLGDPEAVVDIIEECGDEDLKVFNYRVYSGIIIMTIKTGAGAFTLLICPTLAEIEKYEHPC